MRILLAGGGSGGHVTPLRAISRALVAKNEHQLEITVMSDRVFFPQTKFLFVDQPDVKLRRIYSGKFRRYNNKSLVWHILHAPTLFKNIRDIFLIVIGTIQSVNYFLWNKPDVVFCKGGYVCVPIGMAARLFRVPMIIHDSDTHPGLTNRFLSRWATKIATGMPTKYYQYAKNKMVYSGIPVDSRISVETDDDQATTKKKLGFKSDQPVLFVTGGGTGAVELNNAVIAIAPRLLEDGWRVIHLTGKNKAKSARRARQLLPVDYQEHWQVEEFTEVLPYIQAADVVVSRAGATAMQEFANAKKSVILIPSPYLTGGHQLKNAAMFEEFNAVKVIQEVDLIRDPTILSNEVVNLLSKNDLSDNDEAKKLANNLYNNFAKPHAADELATLILNTKSSS